jgi:hypothetical protein
MPIALRLEGFKEHRLATIPFSCCADRMPPLRTRHRDPRAERARPEFDAIINSSKALSECKGRSKPKFHASD